MTFWRIWAALLGSSLRIGETIRSWGQSRNLLFVLDDFFVGVPSNPAASNIEIRLLTALIGLAFASSLAGLVGSMRLADPRRVG